MADQGATARVSAQQLRYCYPEAGAEHTVLDGVSFSLAPGERVALLGSSGSGKSTLLNLLAGIDRPAGGEVLIDGQPLAALAEPALTRFRRRHIGFVYQRFHLIPTLTAAENILLPLDLLGVPQQEQAQRLTHWLAAVGLAGRGDTFPDLLSGGEQQRVAIARALIHEPTLVLADEPTGSLDERTGEQVLELLLANSGRGAQTLLLVTHSEAVAARADRVLVLSEGRLHSRAMAGSAGIAGAGSAQPAPAVQGKPAEPPDQRTTGR
jgi:putative ABC transport system ATP-binding protein